MTTTSCLVARVYGPGGNFGEFVANATSGNPDRVWILRPGAEVSTPEQRAEWRRRLEQLAVLFPVASGGKHAWGLPVAAVRVFNTDDYRNGEAGDFMALVFEPGKAAFEVDFSTPRKKAESLARITAEFPRWLSELGWVPAGVLGVKKQVVLEVAKIVEADPQRLYQTSFAATLARMFDATVNGRRIYVKLFDGMRHSLYSNDLSEVGQSGEPRSHGDGTHLGTHVGRSLDIGRAMVLALPGPQNRALSADEQRRRLLLYLRLLDIPCVVLVKASRPRREWGRVYSSNCIEYGLPSIRHMLEAIGYEADENDTLVLTRRPSLSPSDLEDLLGRINLRLEWASAIGRCKVLHIVLQVGRALSYLHPTILHRDLKPANVLVSNADSETPVVKLADFGLSRLHGTVLVTRNPEVGTTPYVSPEAFDPVNYTISDRADMYALGVILWEMLSGMRPWEGKTDIQVAYAVALAGERLPLSVIPPERCLPKLAALLRDCWDADPKRRPAAAEFVKTIALVQQALGAQRCGVPSSRVMLEVDLV
ncbi:hypothetical protein GPECTOR_12g493 [Gonium pectorale]|uniref:Protein kinase domain-containing protein n=1 Tax=Gonium pectorale TaxID=33097 RepID=A0A150GQA5_GONPE|nr:hypothetical protein GPECTOR_12g493 [Gonium pectorale]|eukprot:KXZ51530.1 hypothetical protein GPECTOR_12g493 [Gonium pectorale]